MQLSKCLEYMCFEVGGKMKVLCLCEVCAGDKYKAPQKTFLPDSYLSSAIDLSHMGVKLQLSAQGSVIFKQ